MKITSTARRLGATTVAVVALSLSLTACGDDTDSPDDPDPTAPTASPEDDAEDAYAAYWDVYVQAANSGEVDPAAFGAVADGAFVETDLRNLRDQADSGVVRVGEPIFGPYTTSVDGDNAISRVCKDDSEWAATGPDGQELPPPDDEPTPFQATLELRETGWIVTDVAVQEGEECPA